MVTGPEIPQLGHYSQRRIPLREFVNEAVKNKLADDVKTAEKPWMKHFGKLKHLHKETARISRLIEEDCERTDAEMRR